MADHQVKLNLRGISAVLRSPEVTSALARRAQKIADAAGPGFEVTIAPGRHTARAYVNARTPEADRAEAEHKALTRALDAGRHE